MMLSRVAAIVLAVLNLIFSMVSSIIGVTAPPVEFLPDLDQQSCSDYKVAPACGVWDDTSNKCKKGELHPESKSCLWVQPGLGLASKVGGFCSCVNCICCLLIVAMVIAKK